MLIVMEVEAMDQERNYRNMHWLCWLMNWALKFMFHIFRQEPPSGTKLNIGSFAIFQEIGKENL